MSKVKSVTKEKEVKSNLPAKISESTLSKQELALFNDDNLIMKDLSDEYFSFDELQGVVQRFLYEGLTTMVDTKSKEAGKVKDAVRLITKSGERWINADVVLVNKLKILPVPSIVDATYIGDKESKTGNTYKNFRIAANEQPN